MFALLVEKPHESIVTKWSSQWKIFIGILATLYDSLLGRQAAAHHLDRQALRVLRSQILHPNTASVSLNLFANALKLWTPADNANGGISLQHVAFVGALVERFADPLSETERVSTVLLHYFYYSLSYFITCCNSFIVL